MVYSEVVCVCVCVGRGSMMFEIKAKPFGCLQKETEEVMGKCLRVCTCVMVCVGLACVLGWHAGAGRRKLTMK